MDGKHKLLVEGKRHVNKALLELSFSCSLHRSEARFAVLLGVGEECIYERIKAILQLNYLAIATTMIKSTLVWEAYFLQLVSHDENRAPGHVLKVHFERFQNHLHRIEWVPTIYCVGHVEVDLVKFLDIKLLYAASKCT